MLSLRSVDLLSNDLALAAGARGHVKIGLVSIFDAHVDSLLLERDSVLVVTERADELLVDAEEAHDQGCVEEGADRQAPTHVVMLATMVSLAVVSLAVVSLTVVSLATVMILTVVILSFKLVATLTFAAFAALAMAALLTAFAVLAALSSLLEMTAAVALVNGGLRNVSQIEWFNSLGQSWEEHLFNAAALGV